MANCAEVIAMFISGDGIGSSRDYRQRELEEGKV
jgi:hypothetical protein